MNWRGGLRGVECERGRRVNLLNNWLCASRLIISRVSELYKGIVYSVLDISRINGSLKNKIYTAPFMFDNAHDTCDEFISNN